MSDPNVTYPCGKCGSPIVDGDDECLNCHAHPSAALPECQLTGTDGNVFAIIGQVSKTLRRAGLPEKAQEFKTAALSCGSYDEVLQLCFKYVDVL